MKNAKHLLVICLIIVVSVLIGHYTQRNSPIVFSSLFIIVGLAIFNLINRNSQSFKPYFMSKYNLFTSKSKFEKTYDIPIDLMFEKTIEVINNSKFHLVWTDSKSFEIMANTKITFRSWGENIYISFEEANGKTKMKFCSAALFQIYAWGKNEENYDTLLSEIENSLIV